MRVFLTILFLFFISQSWAKSDKISEFEIEGISVGDNLLNFYSKKEINKAKVYTYPGDEQFNGIDLLPKNSDQYEMLQFHYDNLNYLKSNKKKLIIDSLVGAIFYPNINDCYKKQDEIVADIKKSLTNFEITYDGEYKAREDTTGKSTMTGVIFESEDGEIGVTCSYYSNEFKKKNNYENNIRVDISTKEFSDWLRYKAFD